MLQDLGDLVGASDAGLAEEWISFREFEGGDVYFGSFTDRSLVPLKKAFGDNPDLLPAAAEPLGFEPLGFGDVGVRVPVFPKVPLGVVVWRGDEEFSPDDIAVLMPLAKTLSIALTNARLFAELSASQAQAAQREKMAVIGTLSAGINHEICNPCGM